MLDQLYPYSKQIISYNHQPEDKSLNVFLMIVPWLAGVKSASQGQGLKMSLFPQILQARMFSSLACHLQRSLCGALLMKSNGQRSYIFMKKNAKLVGDKWALWGSVDAVQG